LQAQEEVDASRSRDRRDRIADTLRRDAIPRARLIAASAMVALNTALPGAAEAQDDTLVRPAHLVINANLPKELAGAVTTPFGARATKRLPKRLSIPPSWTVRFLRVVSRGPLAAPGHR
jgi:hypothetical protein